MTPVTVLADVGRERALEALLDPAERRNCTGNRRMMLGLTLSFPALAAYPHVTWNPDEFIEWSKRTCHTSSEWHAALFVAAVWSVRVARVMSAPPRTKEPWKKGRGFDVIEAMGSWDHSNRAAFAAWAKDPWWA